MDTDREDDQMASIAVLKAMGKGLANETTWNDDEMGFAKLEFIGTRFATN